MRRSLARFGILAASLLLSGLTGCDAETGALSDAGPPALDAADPSPMPDAGALLVDAGAPGTDAGVSPERENFSTDGCSDGVDNDAEGGLDCDDSDCATNPVCCVGSTSAGCCRGVGASLSLGATGCGNGPASACALGEGVALFGSPSPVIEDEALVPQGIPAYAGATLGAPLDVRRTRIAFEARLRAREGRCDDCVDATGIALVPPGDLDGALNHLRLAVLAVSASEEVVLVVNGDVADRAELESGERVVALRSGTNGGLEYSLGGEFTALAGFRLPAALVPAVVGQNENRADEPAVSIVSANLDVTACDVPSATVSRARPVWPASVSGYAPPATLGRPALARTPSGARVAAIPVDGDLYLLEENGVGEWVPPGGAEDPGLLLLAADAGASLSAPWLDVRVDDIRLWYVETANGTTRLLRRSFAMLDAEGSGPATEVLAAEALGVSRVGAATVLPEENLLVAELEDASGVWLEQFTRASSDDAWTPVGALVTPATDDLFAFDRDAVGAPALARFDGLLRLYYAGQRGTRRSVGLLVSTGGTGWRPIGEVLAPSAQGFDRLEVGGPAPVVEESSLALYYVGGTGSERRIGIAGAVGTISE